MSELLAGATKQQAKVFKLVALVGPLSNSIHTESSYSTLAVALTASSMSTKFTATESGVSLTGTAFSTRLEEVQP